MSANKVYSVSEFVSAIKEYLEDGLGNVSIQGEVTGYRLAQERLIFFELKDESSRVVCFMMKYDLHTILEDGMEIRVHGNASLFKKSGGFHVRVREIELVGKGALNKALLMLKDKLEKEGLFAEERKRALPRFPHIVGLITSPDAAAYTDVVRVMNNRWSGVTIQFAPVGVQGPGSISSIVKALRYLSSVKEVDAIILTRGGGSLEDLQSFNSEDLARAIFGSRVPVVCGVGHERDWTIADLVADVRASTPSNAAERVVPDRREILFQIETLAASLEDGLRETIERYQDRAQRSLGLLETMMRSQTEKAQNVYQRFITSFREFDYAIRKKYEKVQHLERLVRTLSPQSTLDRGYSVTRKGGKVLKGSQDTVKGDILSTRLAKGEVISQVT
ncbi:MAG: exodeoxyribonuclease VII large subunit [Candidatus Kerfeldbacteria bacterium RIFCSPLOWO2_01_FULL_48_11]|uniref:Exodeoxyribonuclease 7 large subunit n=1 Tax=Candidatus Kerfeldbacteria bacterium RIFCSPLOWO2_01_FULL_48_11 TaxID=1798543 RepID=A0A1G2B0W4_9BACT|nr:MAG: Exodeoxyribonuclease 7 large subunit [Parcubacteria group bacterium GW2011_GWA2_48_9]KKW16598.1 MAG: Exodeoxyribonuclease 7 large subunit [Parcubacteria group bacterium GW2011_GWC2_49_9]OGY82804.1 MAG: exodeoxyribonuclease VII large subunit [Candidatus Kerfeldbacteria bacterium RIFCSPLOWO2_01_FULL_48_11]HCJ52470.1 exodeoxyribonuclease VII large subunit [Candidatus Kerfeldbacteria bacterium]HCM68582.1 exodeoxyribonuclease VII large subunit [Candidatus Kerfeldbacteria bacterium]